MKCFNQMRDSVIDILQDFELDHQICDHIEQYGVQMLGCSSTVTTIIAKHLDLKRYDRARVDGQFITRSAIKSEITEICKKLVNRNPIQRYFLVIKGVILSCRAVRLSRQLLISGRWERLRVADRGVREGILLGLMGQSL